MLATVGKPAFVKASLVGAKTVNGPVPDRTEATLVEPWLARRTAATSKLRFGLACAVCTIVPIAGIRTPEISWMTPLVQEMSAFVTVMPLTKTAFDFVLVT